MKHPKHIDYQETMKILYLTIGLPRSGKSTLARGMNLPMVNPDSIRLALHGQRLVADAEPMVWTLARYMVLALFEAGHDAIVLDATNITRQNRDAWIDSRWARRFLSVDTAMEICIERASALNDVHIIPVIKDMAAKFEPLLEDETQAWELDMKSENEPKNLS